MGFWKQLALNLGVAVGTVVGALLFVPLVWDIPFTLGRWIHVTGVALLFLISGYCAGYSWARNFS